MAHIRLFNDHQVGQKSQLFLQKSWNHHVLVNLKLTKINYEAGCSRKLERSECVSCKLGREKWIFFWTWSELSRQHNTLPNSLRWVDWNPAGKCHHPFSLFNQSGSLPTYRAFMYYFRSGLQGQGKWKMTGLIANAIIMRHFLEVM